MKIELENINMQELFSAALLQAMSEEQRGILIKDAIQFLMTPKDGGSFYGSKITPLQEAFRVAIRDVAQKDIADYLTTDVKVKEAIMGLIKDAVEKMVNDNRQQTVNTLCEKIIEGLYKDKY